MQGKSGSCFSTLGEYGKEDDWDEANHAYVLTAEQELRKLSIVRPEGARTAVSRTTIAAETWEELLAELEQALPHSEFKPVMLEELREKRPAQREPNRQRDDLRPRSRTGPVR